MYPAFTAIRAKRAAAEEDESSRSNRSRASHADANLLFVCEYIRTAPKARTVKRVPRGESEGSRPYETRARYTFASTPFIPYHFRSLARSLALHLPSRTLHIPLLPAIRIYLPLSLLPPVASNVALLYHEDDKRETGLPHFYIRRGTTQRTARRAFERAVHRAYYSKLVKPPRYLRRRAAVRDLLCIRHGMCISAGAAMGQ